MHQCGDLIRIFDDCYSQSYQTRLIQGGDEPWYLPKNSEQDHHQVVFAHGFFSSALHEIAHWLIAGEARRQLLDYGYWYEADGRSLAQQKCFEQVEIKPQALEWILSQACGHRFHFSFDNLNADIGNPLEFKRAIRQQVQVYCQQGLSARAMIFWQALVDFYRPGFKTLADSLVWFD